MMPNASSFNVLPPPLPESAKRKSSERPKLESVPPAAKVIVTAQPEDETMILDTREAIDRLSVKPKPSRLEAVREEMQKVEAKIMNATNGMTADQLADSYRSFGTQLRRFFWRKTDEEKKAEGLLKQYQSLYNKAKDIETEDLERQFHLDTDQMEAGIRTFDEEDRIDNTHKETGKLKRHLAKTIIEAEQAEAIIEKPIATKPRIVKPSSSPKPRTVRAEKPSIISPEEKVIVDPELLKPTSEQSALEEDWFAVGDRLSELMDTEHADRKAIEETGIEVGKEMKAEQLAASKKSRSNRTALRLMQEGLAEEPPMTPPTTQKSEEAPRRTWRRAA